MITGENRGDSLLECKARYFEMFLPAKDADGMLRIAESFGSFGTYSNEATSQGLGEKLPQRFDAALNYIAGGIDGKGNLDEVEVAGSRTNYFRETYAYGNAIQANGIEPFMQHPELSSTASEVSGRDVIVPAIIYANLLVPGQELAVHTDVPEFRGANRKVLPQWLLVTMLHSGLFDEWRIPIATCVSWFGSAGGGAFTYYPNGPDGERKSITAGHNSAILLDTDKVFHGVERVLENQHSVPPIGQNSRLHFVGGEAWELRENDQLLEKYDWQEIRYSISWKAYCFEDESEKALWQSGNDDLHLDFILDRLEKSLRSSGELSGPRPEPTEFALLLVQHFIKFPRMSKT